MPTTAPGSSSDLVAWLLLLLLTPVSVLLIGRGRSPDGPFLQKIFLLALALRAATAVLFRLVGLESVVAGDPAFYHEVGVAISREWAFGLESGADQYLSPSWSGWGLVWLVATLYYLLGPSLLLVQFLASVAGAWVAVMVYAIAQEVFRDRAVSRTAAVLVAVLPALILWSSQGLKDPFITLALAAILWCVVRSQRGMPPWLPALTLAGLFVVWSFRGYVAYILMVSILASVVLQAVTRPGRAVRSFLLVTGAAAVLAAVVGSQVVEPAGLFTDLSDISQRRQWSAEAASSGFAADADVSTPAGALAFLPKGLLYILLAPFPWQMTNLQQQATLPDMLIWWALFPFLIRGLVLAVRHAFSESSVLLLFSFVLASAYAIASGNLGTVYRQRTQFVVFLVVFIALGLSVWQRQRRERRQGRARGTARPPLRTSPIRTGT